MLDIPTFELHGDGSLTLEGVNIIITDIELHGDDEDAHVNINYSIMDGVEPSNLEEFEHALCRFMMSLAQRK